VCQEGLLTCASAYAKARPRHPRAPPPKGMNAASFLSGAPPPATEAAPGTEAAEGVEAAAEAALSSLANPKGQEEEEGEGEVEGEEEDEEEEEARGAAAGQEALSALPPAPPSPSSQRPGLHTSGSRQSRGWRCMLYMSTAAVV